ncbi:MAG: nitroreductase family protein [Acidimicrobiales bacterium]
MQVELFEALRTTRAMRRFDLTRPVPDASIWTIIEAATRAPSGGNRQPVRWLVVQDERTRRELGTVYRSAWRAVRAGLGARLLSDPQLARVFQAAEHLAEHMGDVPLIIVPCAAGASPASVYPAIQNLLLAARGLGLGTTLTTAHLAREHEVRKILSIPDDVSTYAVIPVGYPLGRWVDVQRRPVEEVTYWNRWDRTMPRPTSHENDDPR